MIVGACTCLASCVQDPDNTGTTTNAPGNESTEPGTAQSTDTSDDSSESDNTSTSDDESAGITTEETTSSESNPPESDTSESTTETKEETTEEQTVVYDNLYGNGAELADAGIDWQPGFFANIEQSIDKSAAVDISAEELLAKMINRDGDTAVKEGEVWRVTEPLILSSDSKYYCNGGAIIAEGGIVIKDTESVVLKDMLICGSIVIENSADIVMYKVYVESNSTAVLIDDSSSEISVKTCRFRGNTAAFVSGADNVTLYRCYAYAHNGMLLAGDNVIVQDCKIFASDTAVSVVGEDVTVRENRIEVYAYGTGVVVGAGSANALVALNEILGVQKSIVVTDSFNCSVILNRAICVETSNNTNLYVIDNKLGGYIELLDNDYLICDGNTYPFDGLVHTITKIDNTNVNGNNITNVNDRTDVGANEDLLPHTNKELFVAMKRKSTVPDASFTTAKNLNAYIEECAKNGTVVVVAPGAYAAYGALSINANHNDTTIYAYGVYNEYAETDTEAYSRGQVTVSGATNVSIYGLTLGYVLPSSGQVRVVEKYYDEASGKYKFTIIPDAGFMDGFTTTDPDIFHTWWPEIFLSDENGEQKFYCEENPKKSHTVTRNDDGTMTFTITLPSSASTDYKEAKSAKALYDRVSIGNVITCRFSFGGGGSYTINGSTNIKFRDTVIYGFAGVLSVVTGTSKDLSFERHHNAVHSENVIDKETYEKYLALEEKWGVDFEVREQPLEDGSVIYRGPASRSGSIDAFHIASNKNGVSVTSSLLESMVDDGSNQKGNSSRMHGYVKNSDGTTTIYYKPLVSSVGWGNSYNNPTPNSLNTMSCKNFSEGDRIYIYTPDGRTVCDSTVLSTAVKEGTLTYDLREGANHQVIKRDYYSVTVKTEDVDFDALVNPNTNAEYDFSDNHYSMTNKVIVDNLSYNSCEYTMDNVMVLNGHSRGFLVKSRGATFKNCTFRNVCNSGFRIMVEPEWGESSVAKNILIERCLFDNVGFHFQSYDDPLRACILIEGTSSVVSENTLPIENITITGCKFTNNKQRIAIRVNSAQNVIIKNNVFDALDFEISDAQKGIAVLLDTCMNVDISDNTYNYAHYDEDNIRSVITGYNFANIHGTDVTNEDGTPKLPDSIR